MTATAGGLNPKDHVIYSWSGTGVTGSDTTAKVDTERFGAGRVHRDRHGERRQAGQGRDEAVGDGDLHGGYYGEGLRAADDQLLGEPQHHQAGRHGDRHFGGHEPAEPAADLQLHGLGGHGDGHRDDGGVLFGGRADRSGGDHVQCLGRQGHTRRAAQTSLTITAPYVPPAPKTQALCSISFATDKKRPMRVDNEAKACLDQVALDLKQQADAKAVVVGEQTADEQAKTAKQQTYQAKHKHATVDKFAAQRAVNAKDYLVTEQGIDASRISVATGTTDGQTEENYLVPAGATFSADVTGTTPVDETAVKPQARKPLPERHPKKKAAK